MSSLDSEHGKSLNIKRTNTTDMWVFNNFETISQEDENIYFKANFKINFQNSDDLVSVQFYNLDGGDFNGVATFEVSEGVFYLLSSLTSDFIELPITFETNKWYDVNLVYNIETGEVYTIVDGYKSESITSLPFYYIQELDFYTGEILSNIFIDDISLVTEANDLSITNTMSKLEVSVYPNPTSDIVKIKSDKVVKNINVNDLTGRKVKTTDNLNEINLSDLSKGVYLLNITFEDGSHTTKKVVKK